MTTIPTIEQAKDAAAKELKYMDFDALLLYAYDSLAVQAREDLTKAINRAMELCIEGERQRIANELQNIISGPNQLPTYSRKNNGPNAYLKPRLYFVSLEKLQERISELKKQLTNK